METPVIGAERREPIIQLSLDEGLARAALLPRGGEVGEALRLWQELRRNESASPAAWISASRLLCALQCFDEADRLLDDARERFADDMAVMAEWIHVPHLRRDWPETVRRCEAARMMFPGQVPGAYVFAGVALRELSQLDAAEALLAEARGRFPTNPGAAVEHAWIAHFRNDWATAAERWQRAREICPDYTSPFVFGGAALRQLGRFDEADGVLSEARRRFPDDAATAFEYCSVAQARRDWPETLSRSEYAIARFPDHPQPLALGGLALREMGRLDEAEARLRSAWERFPGDLPAAIEYARIADARGDRAEAHRRWTEARRVGPNHEAGFIGGAIALRADGRDDEAEELLRQAVILAPTAIHPRMELVRIAEARGNWDEAEAGWHDITARFPLTSHGPIELVATHRRQGRLDDAEAVITAALSRLPDDERLIEQGSLNAIAREDWPLALNRLYAAQTRFPRSHVIRQRLYEVQMRVAGSADAPAEAPHILGGASEEDRNLVMNFESLGGGGHGCEFGIFQRSVGAEPLGLLRWADIFQEQLTQALRLEFAGVGEPEFTRIFVPSTEDRGQYWTTDTRYHMAMGSFVYADQVPMERMSKLIHQRMRFLRAKLIDDLRTGAKIFVYKNMKKTLTDAELARLHAAVRHYGDTTLLYIRYDDAEHPNGMVEWSGPGLMIGYIDHFSHTPDTDVLIERAHGQFLTLCRKAYELWTDRAPQ